MIMHFVYYFTHLQVDPTLEVCYSDADIKMKIDVLLFVYLSIQVNGDIPPKLKKSAHEVILDFIRSRPPLNPVSITVQYTYTCSCSLTHSRSGHDRSDHLLI